MFKPLPLVSPLISMTCTVTMHVHVQRLIPDQLVLSMSCFDDAVQGWRRRQHSVPKVKKKVTQWHGLCAV